MLEGFERYEIILIKKCAELIHSIEDGTVNQRNINALFGTSYFFTAPEDDWEENVRGVKAARAENHMKGNYNALVRIISEKFPEMNQAYLPFMIGDVLREAYEKYNGEVNKNV